MQTLLLTVATVFAGLMAGLFYAWSISVTSGLVQVSNHHYLAAFQQMNRAILNPVFFVPFFGQAIILPILTYQVYRSPSADGFQYLLAATLLYWLGCMAVTMFGNVPLNNTLEVLQIDLMLTEQRADFRSKFEQKWNQLNWIRTICTLLSLVYLVLVCLQNNPK